MIDCNINQEWAYRTKNGEPVPEVPGGPEANKYRNLAMLSDFVESIINWVLDVFSPPDSGCEAPPPDSGCERTI